jgi:hypothetical protein
VNRDAAVSALLQERRSPRLSRKQNRTVQAPQKKRWFVLDTSVMDDISTQLLQAATNMVISTTQLAVMCGAVLWRIFDAPSTETPIPFLQMLVYFLVVRIMWESFGSTLVWLRPTWRAYSPPFSGSCLFLCCFLLIPYLYGCLNHFSIRFISALNTNDCSLKLIEPYAGRPKFTRKES